MPVIQSLLRVMVLRDAEAIILETNKVPSLRRRGQIEKLAMPALEPPLLADFAALLTGGRPLEDGPASLPFHDPDGAHYQVTLEKLAAGLRMVVRPGREAARVVAQPSEERQAPTVPSEPAAPLAAPTSAVQQRSSSSRSPSRYPT